MPESSDDGNFITDEIREKLDEVFSRFKNKVILRAYVDKGELSSEVKGFLEEFKTLTDKVEIQIKNVSADEKNIYIPSIEVSYYDGRETGISFHGVPGGHEFNSFIVALYNVSVELRDMPDIITDKIKNIKNDVNIKIMVSLSCTMCPEVVMAAQKLALISDGIRAEMFDLKHYKSFKEQYNIMSVPCMIINDSKVFFGKKTIDEIADIISN